MIWHCEDCHKVGFYFEGETPQQVQDRHMKDCEATKESELPPTRWPEGAEL
jgi:hypothetical protein